MPSTYFFLKQTDLPVQQAGQGFGPISNDQFNLTSQFTGQSDIMGYACLSGSVLVLNVSDNNLSTVNLILKPQNNIPGLPPLKYIIYRGLRSDSFLVNGQLPAAGTSTLIDNVLKSLNPLKAFSYETMSDTDDLESVFGNSNNQLPTVKGGDSLGLFLGTSGSFGIEVVLDEAGFVMTVATAKKTKNLLDITGLQNDSRQIQAMQCLSYMDPAAFYSYFGHSNQGGIGTNLNSPKTLFNEDVYQLVSKFNSKNQVIIDVRNALNLPYNIFNSNETLKQSQSSSSASSSSESPYSNNSWPICILQNSATTSQTAQGRNYIFLKLSLQADAMIALPMIDILGCTYTSQFPKLSENRLFSECGYATSPWTNDISLALQSASDVLTAPMASYVKVQIIDQSISLGSQIPTALRIDRGAVNFNNLLSPNLSPTFKANSGTVLSIAVNNLIKYCIYSNAGLVIKTGTCTDPVGEVAFAFRCQGEIQPENTSNPTVIKIPANPPRNQPYIQLPLKTENDEILKIKNYINKSTDPVQNTNLFYNYLKSISQYQYRTIKSFKNTDPNKKPAVYEPVYQTEKLANQALNLYNISVDQTNNINCIELRILDTNVLDGDDVTPLEPFFSLAYAASERTNLYTNFINDTTKFSSFGPKYFNYDVNPVAVQSAGVRTYYYFDLVIYGLIYSGSNFILTKQATNLRFYSLDGLNYMTAAYAANAQGSIGSVVWTNSVLPDVLAPGSNPFSDGSQFSSGLKDTLYNTLQNVIATDANGYRLLLGEIRDYLYKGDLDNLSFEIAFRLPFFLEKGGANAAILTRNIVPYNEVSKTVYSSVINPYFKNFSNWFAQANILRTYASNPLRPLAKTGITDTFTSFIKSNPLSSAIYSALSVKTNPSFQSHSLPAWEARLLEDENAYNSATNNLSAPGFHFPATISPSAQKSQNLYNDSQLSELKNTGVISAQVYSDVTGAKGWGILNSPSVANGYYIYKYTTDPSVTSPYVIHKNVTANNNSGFTFGLGFDLGQQSLVGFENYYSEYSTLSELQKEIIGEAIHKHANQAAALYRTFKSVVDSIQWSNYEAAIVATLPFIRTNFLVEGINWLKDNRENGAHILMMVYQNDNNTEFFDGGTEYMNEAEKAIFAAKVYNSGSSSAGVYSNRGKRFNHAVNTHDLRFLKIATFWSGMSLDRIITMTNLINNEKLKNFYDKTKSSL